MTKKKNNKVVRGELAALVQYLAKEKRRITSEYNNARSELKKLFEHRGIESEEYDGIRATYVQPTTKSLDKGLLASRLGLTVEELDQLMEECSFQKDSTPYVKVT